MAQSVVQLTYARVAQGASPGPATSREHDANLDAFLLDHFNALHGLADDEDAPLAQFFDPDTQALFETLRTGAEADFLDAAHQVTLKLIGEMTGATADGLLVCVQVKDGNVLSAGALKLQVMQPHAANLKQLDSGEVLLTAVTDVMDAPGQLQKGALVDDPRADSDVIMGDQLSKEAQYFPRAFGIRIEQRAPQAAADLLAAIAELQGPDVADAARDVLPQISPGLVADVLEGLGQRVPELQSADVRTAVQSSLEARPRPVRLVDTTAALTEVIRASGVTIKMPLHGKATIDIEADDGGGYVIHIHVDEQPKREIQRR